jgi:hypothetical protein
MVAESCCICLDMIFSPKPAPAHLARRIWLRRVADRASVSLKRGPFGATEMRACSVVRKIDHELEFKSTMLT